MIFQEVNIVHLKELLMIIYRKLISFVVQKSISEWVDVDNAVAEKRSMNEMAFNWKKGEEIPRNIYLLMEAKLIFLGFIFNLHNIYAWQRQI